MINLIKATGKDLVKFLKQPADQKAPVQTGKHKLNVVFALLCIDILLTFMLLPIINLAAHFGWVNMDNHAVSLAIVQWPFWQIVLLMVILGPFVEELIFRFFLRYKRNYLLHCLIFVVGKRNRARAEAFFKKVWFSGFPFVFYVSVILFGIVHLFNYEYSSYMWLVAPLLVAPQMLIGAINGYLRVKYNFMLGYSMHAVHNFIFIGIGVLFMNDVVEKLNVTTDEYSFKIEELTRKDIYNSTFTRSDNSDSISIEGLSLKEVVAFLLDTDANLLTSNKETTAERKINLSFINHTQTTADSKATILKHLGEVYEFTIETMPRQEAIWELSVLDPELLHRNRPVALPDSSPSQIVTLGDTISVKNTSLTGVARMLASNYKVLISNNADTVKCFDLSLPRNNFDELIKVMEYKYGLGLVKKEKEIAFKNISFSGNR